MTTQTQTEEIDLDKSTSEAGDQGHQSHAINYEAEAKKLGWRDESHYKGDPSRFVDAKTYYENGQKVLPIIKAENEVLRAEIVRIKDSATQAIAMGERAREREIADLNAQLVAAKAARKAAVTANDGESFEAAETDIKAIENNLASSPATTKQAPQVDPIFRAWVADNPWYEADDRLRAIADGLASAKQFSHLRGKNRELYDAVGAEVTRMDELMTANARGDLNKPGPQGGGRGTDGTRTNGAARRSYENLQPEYKRACDRQFMDFGIKDEKKWRARYVQGCSDDAFN